MEKGLTSKSNEPKISVGLPVFNGENFVKEAIESILNQTHSNFELIISDNASTDQTQEICESYVSKDPRVRYHRNKQNLGVYRNYNRVFELSTGEFFKWAAHDDIIAPEFLSNCLAPMLHDPSIAVVYPKGKIVNKEGIVRADYGCKANPERMSSSFPHERLGEVIKVDTWYPLVGLFRSSFLRRTPMFGIYFMADVVLLARLCLLGKLKEIPDAMVFVRFHRQQSVRKYQNNQVGSVYYATADSNRIVFPRWKKCKECFSAVMKSNLTPYEKAKCYREIIRWFHWRSLLKDLLVVMNEVFRRCMGRVPPADTKPLPHDRS